MIDPMIEELLRHTQYRYGDMTPFGTIVARTFGDHTELLPEFVVHFPDPVNGPKLNQFAYNEPGLSPYLVLEWCTTDGAWNGPFKMRISQFVDDPGGPYGEAILVETNFEKDGTFGIVGPLVLVLDDGRQFVAVNKHQARRFAGPDGLVEGKRRRHGSTDIMPVVTDGPTLTLTEYGVDKIGLLTTNTACIGGLKPDGTYTVARIRGELTVATGLDALPAINQPFSWMPLEEFMFLSMDDHSQAVIGRALVAGYLEKPRAERVAPVLARLAAFVAEQCSK